MKTNFRRLLRLSSGDLIFGPQRLARLSRMRLDVQSVHHGTGVDGSSAYEASFLAHSVMLVFSKLSSDVLFVPFTVVFFLPSTFMSFV